MNGMLPGLPTKPSSVSREVFLATSVTTFFDWVKPRGPYRRVRIYCVGSGAAGGSGRRGATGTLRGGGGGGGGGAQAWADYDYNLLPNELALQVGKGGGPPGPQTVDSTDGTVGGNGVAAIVRLPDGSSLLVADGGSNGAGGTVSGGAAGSGGANGLVYGLAGGSGLGSNGGNIPSYLPHAVVGGGGGGQVTAANVNTAGGGNGNRSTTSGGPGLTAGNTDGQPGGSFSPGMIGAYGGAGGGSGLVGNAGAGGDGGFPGGGGGGGGGSTNGSGNSGAGGKGGDGVIVIVCY